MSFLTIHLDLKENQRGFRKHSSTTSALLPLAHKMATGFKKPLASSTTPCTVTLAIDLLKVFDTIHHTQLIPAVFYTSLHRIIVRWFSPYLRSRHASCRYKKPRRPATLCGPASPKDLSHLQLFSISPFQINLITTPYFICR